MGRREFAALARRPVPLAIVLGFISIALIGTGIWGVVSLSRDGEQLRELTDGAGQTVEATLTEIHTTRADQTGGQRRSNREPKKCPVYSYSVDGIEYSTLDSSDCSDQSRDFTLGSTATVIYDPSDPSVVFIDSPGARSSIANSRLFSVASVIVGGVLGALTPFIVVRARRRRSR